MNILTLLDRPYREGYPLSSTIRVAIAGRDREGRVELKPGEKLANALAKCLPTLLTADDVIRLVTLGSKKITFDYERERLTVQL
jgi:hypothetical protein